VNKSEIRKKILKIRKKIDNTNYSINTKVILKILKKEKIKGKILGGYYPYNHEFDGMRILKEFENLKFLILLPKIKKNYQMDFFKWSFKDPLSINEYGIPEPISKKIKYPDVLLVPMVAFDENFNRIGYGGGFYDRYIGKLKKNKKIITIGLAYSFQKVKELLIKRHDIKLDYVVTEKFK
jgi:5-formyltetrahydrofolate cyclo-ligase